MLHASSKLVTFCSLGAPLGSQDVLRLWLWLAWNSRWPNLPTLSMLESRSQGLMRCRQVPLISRNSELVRTSAWEVLLASDRSQCPWEDARQRVYMAQ